MKGNIDASRIIGIAFGAILMLSGVGVLLTRAIEGVVPLMIGLMIVLLCGETKKKEISEDAHPPRVFFPPIQLSSPTIQCLSCGHRNPKDHSFCGKCGASLMAEKEETRIYQ